MTTHKNNPVWTTIVTIVGLITLPILAIIVLLITACSKDKYSFRKALLFWINTILGLCNIKLNVSGWHDLPETIKSGKESVVFMSNHESNLDPLILVGVIPIPTACLSKKALKWLIPIGWAAAAAGTIFIDRDNAEQAIKSLRAAMTKIRNGQSVIIFPEGTRTRTGTLLPFKKGGFVIAREAGARIVPVATTGGFQILPSGAIHLNSYSSYTVNFGQPIDPKAFKNKNDLIAEVRKQVYDLQQLARC